MKRIITLGFLVLTTMVWSQKNCEFSINETDSTGTYKAIKEQLLHERVFGTSENYVLATLSNYNGTPFLNIKLLQKKSEFIKANCLNKNSKIHFQLENGKIVTLLHEDYEVCGSLYKNEEDQKNVRLLEGNFYFVKNTLSDLKNFPITLMRIVYGTETIDYVIKKELNSELLKQFFRPESFFMNYLHCIEN